MSFSYSSDTCRSLEFCARIYGSRRRERAGAYMWSCTAEHDECAICLRRPSMVDDDNGMIE